MKTLLISVFIGFCLGLNAQVAVNETGNPPDASAVLDASSVTRGFLPPRMTSAQMNAVVNPAEGLFIYNTTVKSIFWHNGSAWVAGQNTTGGSCGSISYGGHTYPAVIIGTQCWLKENLNIGNAILRYVNQTNNSIMEKYCYDTMGAPGCGVYGGLYQWNEMMQYVTTPGSQGICPPGYHIPTDGEWTVLTTFLGGESVAAGPLKETGTVHWLTPNTGATNSSGFTAFGGGKIIAGPLPFTGISTNGYFWSSSISSQGKAWSRSMSYSSASVSRSTDTITSALSVRCLQNGSSQGYMLPSVQTSPIVFTPTTATCGGNVTSEGGSPVTARGVCWSTSPSPTIANSKTTDGSGPGTFTSNITGLTYNTMYYIRAYATNSAGTVYGQEVSDTANFSIGQTYGGGIIFYIDGTGQHGLISASSDQSTGTQWGCIGTNIAGTSTNVGTGQANTTAIVNGCSTSGIAARICDILVLNSYSDWYLPSKNELNLMYQQRTLIGGFANSNYWSSSQSSSLEAWQQNFNGGSQVYNYKDYPSGRVRAIRSY